MLAAGDIDAARQANEPNWPASPRSIQQLACRPSSPRPAARSLSARDPAAALPLLRSAARCWREIDVLTRWQRLGPPAWRVGGGGDEDAAWRELESARSTFARLGARPDLQRVEELLRPTGGGRA